MSTPSPSTPDPSRVRRFGAPRAPANEPPVFCFSIQAEAEPGIMPRVLALFAKRNLVPRRWVSDVGGSRGRDLWIDLQVAGLSPDRFAHIARCLRQIPGVTVVLTSEKGSVAATDARMG